MQLELTPHSAFPTPSIETVLAEAERSAPGLLTFWYTIYGQIADLALPSPAAERRAEGLWATTCFEAFLKEPNAVGYREFNFSPSSQWAAYRFDSYRQGMRDAPLIHPPIISCFDQPRMLEMHVTLPVDPAPGARLGLAAVIEEKDGRKSYWALAHPPGAPDFHHETCFALELPPARGR